MIRLSFLSHFLLSHPYNNEGIQHTLHRMYLNSLNATTSEADIEKMLTISWDAVFLHYSVVYLVVYSFVLFDRMLCMLKIP